MHKIGFIGLGNMGAPLCERLLLKNKVNIFDINKSILNKMENLGLIFAPLFSYKLLIVLFLLKNLTK